ncbi:hypothetical protein [Brachybacterium huguangmaarense]
MPAAPLTRSARRPAAALALVLALAALVATAVLGIPAARADGPSDGAPDDASAAPGPVRLVLVTAGLTWADISPEHTPTLACLADRSGVGAMNTSSITPVSTRAQGSESLHTGYRGTAADAPRDAGIPDPPQDLLAALPGGVSRLDAQRPSDTTRLAAQLTASPGRAAPALVEAELPSMPPWGVEVYDSSREGIAETIDARAAEILAPLGGCDAPDLPRTLLVSVAADDGPAGKPGSITLSRAVQLQLALDTGLPGQVLTSGTTHQSGVITLIDIAPTILASHGVTPPDGLPGRPVSGLESADARRLALDRTQAAGLVDRASIPALASWLVPGALGLVVLAVPALARRRRVAAAARPALTVAPLALPVGLCASLLPWWRAEHPALALTGVIWAGSLVLSVVVLAGPWRRHRLGPPGVAGALTAGIILLESATGSRLQLGSPLGAQALSGGRYYGLSNHLFGIVLAASLLALLALFTVLRSRRARVVATVIAGGAVAAVCVAPTMGADFGSMLVTVPTFGLLALLVSGIRVRAWHVAALVVGGGAAVMGVSLLDWLRPPEQRTHLGRFIDDVLSGRMLDVITRKLAQNVDMLTGVWPLAVIVMIALGLTVAMLMPRRAGLERLAALDAAHPEAYAVRVALAAGGWLGYAVNDTGPVLVAGALGIALALLLPMLPDPAPGTAREG